MKEKFLIILYEMKRMYSSPINRIFKKRAGINCGMCRAMERVKKKTQCFLFYEEAMLFWAILKEEGEKYGLTIHPLTGSAIWCSYWWKCGKCRPRLKTIKAAIKRIENSNVQYGKLKCKIRKQ